MDIFIIKIDKFMKFIDEFSICNDFSSRKRCIEFSLGRFLTKFVAKNFYNLENTDILICNKKPVFLNSKLYFSISHSKNIVAVAFDNNDVGLDFEFLKPRNLEKFCRRMNKKFQNEIEFYQYWTSFEAQYKSKPQFLTSFKFEDYIASVSSFSKIDKSLKLYEIHLSENIAESNNLIDLRLVNNVSDLNINEVNTDCLEFLPSLNMKIP